MKALYQPSVALIDSSVVTDSTADVPQRSWIRSTFKPKFFPAFFRQQFKLRTNMQWSFKWKFLEQYFPVIRNFILLDKVDRLFKPQSTTNQIEGEESYLFI